MNKTITLLFSGDFAPLVPPQNIRSDHFSELQPIFEECDLHITNLECPLTIAHIPIKKSGPSIKANPQSVELLKQANVSVACLANNHIFDYDEKGITDTLTICEENKIDTVGIVSRADGQKHWLIKEVKGKRIGFLNYCEHEYSVRAERLLGANGYGAINAFYDIQQLRPQVNYLIVIYHGGNEYYPLPNPQVKKDFHYLADLGADAVIGHHTHVFSGYEEYKGKPMIYSLGNFFFPFANEPKEWHQAVLCKLTLDKNIKVGLIPIVQCEGLNLNVTLPDTQERDYILNTIENLSKVIQNDEELKEEWTTFVQQNGIGLYKTFMYSTKAQRLLFKLGLFQNQKRDRNRANIIENIIRCNSLKEVLLNYFHNAQPKP